MPFNEDPATDLIGSALGSTGAGIVGQVAPLVAQAATQITDSIMQGIYGYKGPEFNPVVAQHAMDAAMNYTLSTNQTILGLAALANRKQFFMTDGHDEINQIIARARVGLADIKANHGEKAKIYRTKMANLNGAMKQAQIPTRQELETFRKHSLELAAMQQTAGNLCKLYDREAQKVVLQYGSMLRALDASVIDTGILDVLKSITEKVVTVVEKAVPVVKEVIPYVEQFAPIIKQFVS